MSGNNPYLTASDAYGATAAATDQRALEGKILMRAALRLEELASRIRGGEKPSLEEIGSALEYNQKLWTVFVAETMNEEHPLPQNIKNNIASLGLFVFKRTKDLLVDTTPEKITALVDINRNIATGLLKQMPIVPQPATPNPLAAKPASGKRPVEEATDSLV